MKCVDLSQSVKTMETSLYAFVNLIKVKENQQITDSRFHCILQNFPTFSDLGSWSYLKYAFTPVNLEIDVVLALFI